MDTSLRDTTSDRGPTRIAITNINPLFAIIQIVSNPEQQTDSDTKTFNLCKQMLM